MTNIFNIKTGKPHEVADFGSHGKRRQLEIKMDNLKRMLSARYKHLDKLILKIDKIEAECKDFETKYTTILLGYAERIGVENVDPEYLDYTNAIKFEQDERGIIKIVLDLDANMDRHSNEEEPKDAA